MANRGADEFGEINVVPLVDVMLVLLAIVLVTATFVVNGRIPVDLAQASSAVASTRDALVVTMTKDHRIFLNDRPTAFLEHELTDYAQDTPVLIRADGALPLADFVGVVDRIKAIGFTIVNLEVKRT